MYSWFRLLGKSRSPEASGGTKTIPPLTAFYIREALAGRFTELIGVQGPIRASCRTLSLGAHGVLSLGPLQRPVLFLRQKENGGLGALPAGKGKSAAFGRKEKLGPLRGKNRKTTVQRTVVFLLELLGRFELPAARPMGWQPSCRDGIGRSAPGSAVLCPLG